MNVGQMMSVWAWNSRVRKSGRGAVLTILAATLAGCGAFGGGDPETTPTIGERVPILSRIASGIEADPALAGVAVALPPPVTNEEWAQAGGSASKSYGHLALAAAPIRIWSATIAGSSNEQRLAAPPVVGNGTLYVFDTNGIVHAFDAATGADRWEHSLRVKGDGASAVFGGGASYNDGRLFVTTGVGEVAALDAATGAEIWKVQAAGPLRGSPTIAFGAVYVMTQDNQIIALKAGTGEQIWSESGSTGLSGVFGVAAPAAGQGTVIAGYSSGELIAYRYENGRNLWADALAKTSISTSVGTLTDIDADPIIDSGRVYALGQGGRMAAYELVTGQRIWELNVAGISTPAVAGNWIFALTDDARMLAVARSSGRIRWISQLRRWKDEKDEEGPIFWSGPVLAGGRLWVASTRGEVWSLDVADGSAVMLADVKAPVSLAPIVANDTLYVLSDEGRITAFR